MKKKSKDTGTMLDFYPKERDMRPIGARWLKPIGTVCTMGGLVAFAYACFATDFIFKGLQTEIATFGHFHDWQSAVIQTLLVMFTIAALLVTAYATLSFMPAWVTFSYRLSTGQMVTSMAGELERQQRMFRTYAYVAMAAMLLFAITFNVIVRFFSPTS